MSRELGTGRTPAQCLAHSLRWKRFDRRPQRSTWSEQDDQLLQVCGQYGGGGGDVKGEVCGLAHVWREDSTRSEQDDQLLHVEARLARWCGLGGTHKILGLCNRT